MVTVFLVFKKSLEKTDKYKAIDDLTKPEAQVISVKKLEKN